MQRKYNNGPGQAVPEQWVFGGYDPNTKKGFLVPVDACDADTLWPIIQEWVAPGTTIYSDQWRAYNNLQNIGYNHQTVIHSLYFVDLHTGVNTNCVEAMWQRAKAKFKSMHGPGNRDLIADYLIEYMWYQRFSDVPFYHFWYQIATQLYVI